MDAVVARDGDGGMALPSMCKLAVKVTETIAKPARIAPRTIQRALFDRCSATVRGCDGPIGGSWTGRWNTCVRRCTRDSVPQYVQVTMSPLARIVAPHSGHFTRMATRSGNE